MATPLAHHFDVTTAPRITRERYCHTLLNENIAFDNNSILIVWVYEGDEIRYELVYDRVLWAIDMHTQELGELLETKLMILAQIK